MRTNVYLNSLRYLDFLCSRLSDQVFKTRRAESPVAPFLVSSQPGSHLGNLSHTFLAGFGGPGHRQTKTALRLLGAGKSTGQMDDIGGKSLGLRSNSGPNCGSAGARHQGLALVGFFPSPKFVTRPDLVAKGIGIKPWG